MSGSVELPSPHTWHSLVSLAVREDLGSGDITTALVVPEEALGEAQLEARQALVVCGLPVARQVLDAVEPALEFEPTLAEGDAAPRGSVLARIRGPLRGLLAAERVMLNFLMRMSGVASWTRDFVRAVEGTQARIVDTRKTLPGWRSLDKYACAVGGAWNHRVGLYDGILLKDNHIAAAGGVALAVKAARSGAPPQFRVQVEVESEEDAMHAIEAGADFLLLDNWSPEALAATVPRLREHALLEASGGVNIDNVRAYAESGVSRISIGALTHSAPAADLALELCMGGPGAGGRTA